VLKMNSNAGHGGIILPGWMDCFKYVMFFCFFFRDGSHGAFTPFSVCLGNMLHELHRCLCLALSAESSVLVLTQLLRVISVMVQNTPYHRLRVGLLSKIISSIRAFVRHSGNRYYFFRIPGSQAVIVFVRIPNTRRGYPNRYSTFFFDVQLYDDRVWHKFIAVNHTSYLYKTISHFYGPSILKPLSAFSESSSRMSYRTIFKNLC